MFWRNFTAAVFLALITFQFSGAFAQTDTRQWNAAKMTQEKLETQYGTEKDAIGIEDSRALMLDLVNTDRREREGLAARLKVDPLANKVAQLHAEDMAVNRYLGHFNLDGKKAPQRYNEAGGTKFVIENVSYWEVENFQAAITPQMISDVQRRWLLSPGHYKAIMTPEATHFGFGIALERHSNITVITAVQLFVVDRAEFQSIPRKLKRSNSFPPAVNLNGRLDPGLTFAYVAVGVEQAPKPVSADYLNNHLSPYSTPQPIAGYLEQAAEGRKRLSSIQTYYTFSLSQEGNAVKGQVLLDDGHGTNGLYYVYLFARDSAGNLINVTMQTCEVY